MQAIEEIQKYLDKNQIYRIDEFLKNGKEYAMDMGTKASLVVSLGQLAHAV